MIKPYFNTTIQYNNKQKNINLIVVFNFGIKKKTEKSSFFRFLILFLMFLCCSNPFSVETENHTLKRAVSETFICNISLYCLF